MKTIGRIALVAALAALIAGIWTPWHWQLIATAVVLMLTGAAILGQKADDADPALSGQETPQSDEQVPQWTRTRPADSVASTGHTGHREFGQKADR